MKKILPFSLLVSALSACFDANDEFATNTTGPGFTKALEQYAGSGHVQAVPRLKAQRLGPDERRVMLFVLPGDATVEVDGRQAFRRNGFVELVGKVGEMRRLRVFKGARSTEEKNITIGDGVAMPSLIDLNEIVPRIAAPTKKKAKPLVFGDIDE